MRHLHFGSVRGDLQEGHGCSSRCQSLYFRAHKRHFCALLPSGTLIFGLFEHKIEVFVRFRPPEPPFSGFSSTKSGFLCFFGLRDPCFRAFRAQNRGFCARLLNWMSGLGDFPAERGIVAPAEPLHLRSRYYRRCTCAAAVPAQPSYLRSRCAICRRL